MSHGLTMASRSHFSLYLEERSYSIPESNTAHGESKCNLPMLQRLNRAYFLANLQFRTPAEIDIWIVACPTMLGLD
jgi:hypothetical protein